MSKLYYTLYKYFMDFYSFSNTVINSAFAEQILKK